LKNKFENFRRVMPCLPALPLGLVGYICYDFGKLLQKLIKFETIKGNCLYQRTGYFMELGLRLKGVNCSLECGRSR